MRVSNNYHPSTSTKYILVCSCCDYEEEISVSVQENKIKCCIRNRKCLILLIATLELINEKTKPHALNLDPF